MTVTTTKNKLVVNKMKKYLIDCMGLDEIKHYKKEFKSLYKTADSIYRNGNLDIYDYDLFKTLKDFGVNTKPVKEYEKVLDWDCTYRHRENIRNEYIKSIYYALDNMKELED